MIALLHKTRFATFKTLLILLVLIPKVRLRAQDSPQKQDATSVNVETASVQGTVLAAATGDPLRGARVVLTLIDGRQPRSFSSATDSEGHFLIPEAPPGRYTFQASKNGYVFQSYRPEAGGADSLLELTAGQKLENVLFRLKRAAVILGRITNENGEPMAGVSVEAIVAKARLQDQQSWNSRGRFPAKSTTTNDLGEYRLFGLPAGSYYVAAVDSGLSEFIASQGGWSSDSGPQGVGGDPTSRRPPLYFPGVSQRSQAQEIRLVAGQEVRVDLSLRPEKTVTVSGRVFDPVGKPVAGAVVSIHAQSLEEIVNYRIPVETDAQGRFEMKGLTPGSYTLSATSYGAQERAYAVEQSIEVAGTNVSGVRLQLNGSIVLTGRLTAVGGANLDLSKVQVSLFRQNGGAAFGYTTKEGTFSLQDVYPTIYSLELYYLPEGWYLSAAAFGSDNVLDRGLKINEGAGRHVLEITLRHGTARIEGAVMRGDDPVPGAVVMLAPEAAGPYRLGLERTTRTDQHGHFVFANISPGNYRSIAVRGESDGNDEAPALDASSGEKIAVAEGESKTVELKLTTREP
jgi:protocatechuate 3,4-dioxygenase beta subunit